MRKESFPSHQDSGDDDKDTTKSGRSSQLFSFFSLFLTINETHTHRRMGVITRKKKERNSNTDTVTSMCRAEREENRETNKSTEKGYAAKFS